jgi:hypothetical protein
MHQTGASVTSRAVTQLWRRRHAYTDRGAHVNPFVSGGFLCAFSPRWSECRAGLLRSRSLDAGSLLWDAQEGRTGWPPAKGQGSK